jgi:hypothetical protein
MRLYEEYLQRHLLSVPLVRHEDQGSIILRTTDAKHWNSRWIFVTIRWQDQGIHPGKYYIEFYSPIHDGYGSGRLFSKSSAKEIEWDEYEDYFLAWSNGLEGFLDRPSRESTRVVSGEKEVILTAWEVFLFCYDGWFAAQSSELRSYIDRSIDLDLPLERRYIGYQDSLIYLTARHPAILKSWKYDMLGLVQNYSHWLAQLIDGKKDLRTRQGDKPDNL